MCLCFIYKGFFMCKVVKCMHKITLTVLTEVQKCIFLWCKLNIKIGTAFPFWKPVNVKCSLWAYATFYVTYFTESNGLKYKIELKIFIVMSWFCYYIHIYTLMLGTQAIITISK